jgi:alkane 1-monooxygenase
MRWRFFKYLSPFIVFFLAFIAFTNKGWVSFLPVLWSFVLIPFLELFLNPSPQNLSIAEEELVKTDPVYDYLLYATVVFQYGLLLLFLSSFQEPNVSRVTLVGRISSMGLLCGIMGINVGHELGHRSNKAEQFMAKLLLLSSQYLHFFIEHNKGHHKHVATPKDPASARFGENLFIFYPRTILGSYINAWSIANKEVRNKGYGVFSIKNEMLLFTLIQILFCFLIFYFWGVTIFLYYVAAAFIGIGLLEAVNYIEHYGLQRVETEHGKFERTLPKHSWNSNHVLGRMMLFELSRHSDHHYLASRKYQILRHFDDSPQMPTGYPGMIILAHLPPLFFYVMNKRVKSVIH